MTKVKIGDRDLATLLMALALADAGTARPKASYRQRCKFKRLSEWLFNEYATQNPVKRLTSGRAQELDL